MLTSRKLEIFVALCECGNMSKVAKDLLITQSSVSQIVIDIEKEYGIKLFERMQNSLKMTPICDEMYKIAKTILSDYNRLDSLLNLNTDNRKLRIGATITVSSTVLDSILLKFYQRFPHIKLNLIVNNTPRIENALLDNKLDIALVEGKVKNENLVVIEAMHDELVFVCGLNNKMANKKSITLKEISTCALSLREPGSGNREELIDAFKEKNINDLNIVSESSSYAAIIKGVKVNLGVSILSKRLILDDFKRNELWMCPISDFNTNRKFSIVYHKDKYLSKDMELFISNCKEIGSEDPIQ